MKWLLCIVGLALALAPCAAADAPAGFVSHPELAQRVQFVAGKPINVYCAADHGVWLDTVAARRVAALDPAGFADLATGVDIYLSDATCPTLVAKVTGRPLNIDFFARDLRTITHEAEHLAGHRDEHETDCAALAVIRDVARNFGFKRARFLNEIENEAWYWHNASGLPYSGPC